jgi:hypothetical protein
MDLRISAFIGIFEDLMGFYRILWDVNGNSTAFYFESFVGFSLDFNGFRRIL